MLQKKKKIRRRIRNAESVVTKVKLVCTSRTKMTNLNSKTKDKMDKDMKIKKTIPEASLKVHESQCEQGHF